MESLEDEEYRKEHEKEFQEALSNAESITPWRKSLLPHEQNLLEKGELQNVTHKGSSSLWLEAPSSTPPDGKTLVYRPMGDLEVKYLLDNNQLPDTQPYQAIIAGYVGRWYANKYLTGKKWTDTKPSTIVEFVTPTELVETLKKMQCKVEDGAISMGLGNKAGKGLPLFNKSIAEGNTSWRIVKVKRNKKK